MSPGLYIAETDQRRYSAGDTLASSLDEESGFGFELITDGPTVAEYANEETGRVETDGLREAIGDWRVGEIGTGLLRDVIKYWRSGEPVG